MVEQARTHNNELPKAVMNGFDWMFVQSSTVVILLNFCSKNQRLGQYPNRCDILKKN